MTTLKMRLICPSWIKELIGVPLTFLCLVAILMAGFVDVVEIAPVCKICKRKWHAFLFNSTAQVVDVLEAWAFGPNWFEDPALA